MLAAQYIESINNMNAEVWRIDDCIGITGTYLRPEL
jgi:hypothetical protein